MANGPSITRNQLRGVMFEHLSSLAPSGRAVTVDTKHGAILDTEEFRKIYRSAVMFNLQADQPTWPADWLDKTIEELLSVLLPETE